MSIELDVHQAMELLEHYAKLAAEAVDLAEEMECAADLHHNGKGQALRNRLDQLRAYERGIRGECFAPDSDDHAAEDGAEADA